MNQRQSDYFASVREKYNICHKCSSFRDYKNDGLCIQCDKEEKEELKKHRKIIYERRNKILNDKREEIIDRYNNLESYSDIGRDLKIPSDKVARFLKRNGIKTRSLKETYRLKKIKEFGRDISAEEARQFLISELNALKVFDELIGNNQIKIFVENQKKIVESWDDLTCIDKFIERYNTLKK